MRPDIVYEDEYLIACCKPYGVPSQPDRSGEEDMLSMVKNYLFDNSDIDEEPYLAVINRLDRPVGGIILFAKDERTAAAMSDLLQDGKVSKFYQAVLTGLMDEPEGEFTDWLMHDKKTNVTKVVKEGTRGAKRARLSYEVLDELDTDEGDISYVLIELHTGRHHQIRCQMAAHGAGIYGDLKYNPVYKGKTSYKTPGTARMGKPKSRSKSGKFGKSGPVNAGRSGKKQVIGLFSTKMEFTHPVTGEQVMLHREPEGGAFDIVDQMDF